MDTCKDVRTYQAAAYATHNTPRLTCVHVGSSGRCHNVEIDQDMVETQWLCAGKSWLTNPGSIDQP